MELFGKIRRLLTEPIIQVDLTGFVFAIAVSLLSAVAISLLYNTFYERRATGAQIHRSFLLISPSVTALFLAIQFSLPLSLGLLGALSIIRFRTPIKEPEEVGFIMVLIASSVVCATFQFMLLFALLGSVTLALFLRRLFTRTGYSGRQDGVVVLTVDGDISEDARNQLTRILDTRLENGKLEGLSFSEEQGVIQYSFCGANPERLNGLTAAIEEITPVRGLNVFFSNQGVLF